MRLLSLLRHTALAALATVGGCTSNLDPSDASGTYVLRTIAGDALPAVAFKGVFIESPPVVLADTIRLRGDGTGTRATTTRGSTGGPEEVTFHQIVAIGVNVHGRDVDLYYVCAANANCIGIGPAHLTSGGLVIDATEAERGPQVYRRISASP